MLAYVVQPREKVSKDKRYVGGQLVTGLRQHFVQQDVFGPEVLGGRRGGIVDLSDAPVQVEGLQLHVFFLKG
ncbi:MAG: hypothetical protein PUD08_05745 [bacterium]|nr:hypothetical protein [bacterium]